MPELLEPRRGQLVELAGHAAKLLERRPIIAEQRRRAAPEPPATQRFG